jgi:hypothetical protein
MEWWPFMSPMPSLTSVTDGWRQARKQSERSTGLVAAGRKFASGDQRPCIVAGDLALTSTRLPDGSVTAEVARRQGDGTWLWVIDPFSMA